MMTEYSFI